MSTLTTDQRKDIAQHLRFARKELRRTDIQPPYVGSHKLYWQAYIDGIRYMLLVTGEGY